MAGFLLIPWVAQARPLKTTIHEILLDPAQYKGKTLEVEGTVKALKEVTAKKGQSSMAFELTADNSTACVQVWARKKPACHEGDYVKVKGRFKQKIDSPSCCWHGSIDAASVTKVVQSTCK